MQLEQSGEVCDVNRQHNPSHRPTPGVRLDVLARRGCVRH